MRLDWPRLSYILLNLVSNAIKFSPLYSSVLIRVGIEKKRGEEPAKVTIFVEDEGIGLSRRDIQQLFRPYSSARDIPTEYREL